MNLHFFLKSKLLRLLIISQLLNYPTTIFALPSSHLTRPYGLPHVSSQELISQLQSLEQPSHGGAQRHTYDRRTNGGISSSAEVSEVPEAPHHTPHSHNSLGSVNMRIDWNNREASKEKLRYLMGTLQLEIARRQMHWHSPHSDFPRRARKRLNEPDQEAQEESPNATKRVDSSDSMDVAVHETSLHSNRKREPTANLPGSTATNSPRPYTSSADMNPVNPPSSLDSSQVQHESVVVGPSNDGSPMETAGLSTPLLGSTEPATRTKNYSRMNYQALARDDARLLDNHGLTAKMASLALHDRPYSPPQSPTGRLSVELGASHDMLTAELHLHAPSPPSTPVNPVASYTERSQHPRPIRTKRKRYGITEIEPYPESEEESGGIRDSGSVRKKLSFDVLKRHVKRGSPDGGEGPRKKLHRSSSFRSSSPMDEDDAIYPHTGFRALRETVPSAPPMDPVAEHGDFSLPEMLPSVPPKDPVAEHGDSSSREKVSFPPPARALSAPVGMRKLVSSDSDSDEENASKPKTWNSEGAGPSNARAGLRKSSPHFGTRLASFHEGLDSLADSMENISLKKPQPVSNSPPSRPDSPRPQPIPALNLNQPMQLFPQPTSDYRAANLGRNFKSRLATGRIKPHAAHHPESHRMFPHAPHTNPSSPYAVPSSPESPSPFTISSSPESPFGHRSIFSPTRAGTRPQRIPGAARSESQPSAEIKGTPKRGREYDASDEEDNDTEDPSSSAGSGLSRSQRKKAAKAMRIIYDRIPQLQRPDRNENPVQRPPSPKAKRWVGGDRHAPPEEAAGDESAPEEERGRERTRRVRFTVPQHEDVADPSNPSPGSHHEVVGEGRHPGLIDEEEDIARAIQASLASLHETHNRDGSRTGASRSPERTTHHENAPGIAGISSPPEDYSDVESPHYPPFQSTRRPSRQPSDSLLPPGLSEMDFLEHISKHGTGLNLQHKENSKRIFEQLWGGGSSSDLSEMAFESPPHTPMHDGAGPSRPPAFSAPARGPRRYPSPPASEREQMELEMAIQASLKDMQNHPGKDRPGPRISRPEDRAATPNASPEHSGTLRPDSPVYSKIKVPGDGAAASNASPEYSPIYDPSLSPKSSQGSPRSSNPFAPERSRSI